MNDRIDPYDIAANSDIEPEFTLAQYQTEAQRTKSEQFHVAKIEASLGAVTFRDMFHATIGLVTEIGEIKEAFVYALTESDVDFVNLDEEMGDVLWYIAINAKVVNFSLTSMEDRENNLLKFSDISYNEIADRMLISASNMLDLFKKSIFYGKALDLLPIRLSALNIYHLVGYYANKRGTTVLAIMRQNNAKLKARYPEKFGTQEALFRDLGNERAMLEANDPHVAALTNAAPVGKPVPLATDDEELSGPAPGVYSPGQIR